MDKGKSGKKRRTRRTQRADELHRARPEQGRPRASRKASAAPRRGESWYAAKGPVLRFVLLLAGLMAVFNAIFEAWLAHRDVFFKYLALNARLSAAVLRLFGDDASASGQSLASSRYSLSIREGCDAIQASAFFVFAVLAFPSVVSRWSRLPPLLLGTALLLVINLIRIVSLYYTGVYFPSAFETVHIDVWQTLFVFLPLVFWMIWLRSEGRSTTMSADVSK